MLLLGKVPWPVVSVNPCTVEGGHPAIFFSCIGGQQQDTILAKGLHFRIPWFQYPVIYDIRARPPKISSRQAPKTCRCAQELPSMHQRRGTSVAIHCQRGAQECGGQVQASQLISQQAQVSLLICRELTERAKDFSLILDDAAITELSFS
ncbi:Prohibitin-2 [Plecturocebus cupreus]